LEGTEAVVPGARARARHDEGHRSHRPAHPPNALNLSQLLAIRATDPLASSVDCLSDLSRVPPGIARIAADVAHWFRVYKVTEGKGENQLAFGGKWLGAAEAAGIIASTHAQWRKAVDARRKGDAPMRYGLAGALEAAKPKIWLPQTPGWQVRTGLS
jgi:hypothetical protein